MSRLSDDSLESLDVSSRRALLRRLCLAPLGVAAAGWLAGCGEGQDDGEGAGDALESGLPEANATAPGNASWAVGGTKAMRGSYPDPFAGAGAGTMCALYPALTIGPCYARGPAQREDISDGITGLPLRLSFLVVRGNRCTPVRNAEIDIWHTGSNGVYSAFGRGICNPERLPVANQRFCRGTQTTDANGRANFSTVFPGWYSGRSIHIHFTVRVNGRGYMTSQLFFDDLLSDEIMASTEYRARGKRDTTNRNDSILRGVNLSQVLLSSAKREDGALHAWKVLSIRS